MQSSIEISKKGEIFCDYLSAGDVNNFLMLFALTAKESDYKYMKMNEGMVQPMKKDIVISFGIEIYHTEFYIKNVLSSMDFEDVKKFIADGFGL